LSPDNDSLADIFEGCWADLQENILMVYSKNVDNRLFFTTPSLEELARDWTEAANFLSN
jgi:hypothetical protein